MTSRRSIHRFLPLIALMAIIAAPLHAQKRRAVLGSTPPGPVATLKGQVVDAATGKPVIDALVSSTSFTARTNQVGFFSGKIPVGKSVSITFERAGYQKTTQNVTIPGDTTATYQMTSKPTLRITMNDGTVYDVDAETAEFGHNEGFDFRRAPTAAMCGTGGEPVDLSWSQIRRIPGAATWAGNASCCSGHQIEKMTVQLVSGETRDLFFKDSCPGYEMQLVAHDHVTNQLVFVLLSGIRDAVFP